MWTIVSDKYFETFVLYNNFEEVYVYYMLILHWFIYSLLYILINCVYKLDYVLKHCYFIFY
jgi:hypothetical protein